MSHFSVAVFMADDKQSIDALLAPYDENLGNIYTCNPNAKWDSYAVGGRWQDMLILKNKKSCDDAYVRNIDFEAMKKLNSTNEKHLKRRLSFNTFAAITPDGKWHEQGKMHGWGISSATPKEERAWKFNYYDRFIKPALENNWYLVIIDCHI